LRDSFDADFRELIEIRLNGGDFDPHQMLVAVTEIAGIEKRPPETISARTGRFLSVFLNERYKYERYRDQKKNG
jgi:hypothetical protein